MNHGRPWSATTRVSSRANVVDPFGVPLTDRAVYNPFRFTREAWDAEAELPYLPARYYQPARGRFLSSDPWPGSVWQPGEFVAQLRQQLSHLLSA